MATLAEIRSQYPQYADMSDSDLASALHKKFYSDMPKEDFDKRLGLKAEHPKDKYRIAAEKEFADLKAKGVPVEQGYARRVLQGMTFGGADEILAGLRTPIEMARHGTFDPREGYNYAKAQEDVAMDDARQRQGILGTLAEIGGGFGTGGSLASAGYTLVPRGAGVVGRVAGTAGEGAVLGGVSGALDGGNSLDERLAGAGKGAAAGAAIGGAVPLAGAIASPVVAPIASAVRARINPQGVAESQFGRAISESGMTPSQIERSVRQAAAEGQGVYTVADAMGNAGQRMLSTVTRAPGPGRQTAVEFLDNRQADQARRIAQALTEGLDSPQTAQQLETAITRFRQAQANRNYGAAREQAGPVDTSRAIAAADDFLTPGVNRIANPGTNIADDSVEAAVRRARSLLTDGRSQVSDFTTAHRAKIEIDNLIENGTPSQRRVLIPIRNALDEQLAASSQPYANARNTYRRQSQQLEAIPEGSTAATRGRSEDTIPAFRQLTPGRQAGFRTGYADRLIEQAQGAAPGVNKARPLLNDATRAELAALAPQRTGAQMGRRLERENQMFETRNHATGGSRTADNLADAEAQRIDPSVVGALLSGHPVQAGVNVARSAFNGLTGYTPEVRRRVAELLLDRGHGVDISTLINRLDSRQARIDEISRLLRLGAGGGTSAQLPTISGSRNR